VQRLFVTGTDTGVGKTFVATALLAEGRRRGQVVIGHKPIETGCDPIAEDARALGGEPQYALKLPAAPSVAAAAQGVTIDLDEVVARIRTLESADLLIVEGAGGWRVPITPTEDMAALARRLGYPVLIVARAGLGTINHSLLTIEAVLRDGCAIHAVTLSVRPDDDLEFARSNRDEIARRSAVRVTLFAARDLLTI
jgi:dethiobiotin synthetase